MRNRVAPAGLACLALIGLGGCATPPEKDPVQIKLKELDARVERIERVVTNQSLLELVNEMESLRGDVRSMHNDVDLLNNSLEQARKQQRNLYADLDQRLKAQEARATQAPPMPVAGDGAGAGAATGTTPGTPATAGTAATGPAVAGPAPAGAAAVVATAAPVAKPVPPPAPDANDRSAYQAAFALLKDSQYEQAVAAFQAFLVNYADSPLAENAQYWLGEAHYVNRNFTVALAAFQRVIDKYPQSRKLPDALLKVGYCYDELKQPAQAKAVLADLVSKFADTPAGRLAQQRLEKLDSEKR